MSAGARRNFLRLISGAAGGERALHRTDAARGHPEREVPRPLAVSARLRLSRRV